MATISTLSVNLTARTSVFEKKMKKSTKSLRGLTAQVANTQRRMMQFAKGLMAVAGAGAMVAMTRSTMNQLDATAKLADRLGVATDKLMALQHASEITGVGAEGFNKSMEMLVRRLGEVRMGVGEAKNALDSLGLSVNELVQKDPSEVFRIIAARVKKLGTQYDQTAALAYLFGRQGGKLLNMMRSDLDKIVESAYKMGLTFERWELKKIEQANDAMQRLKDTSKALWGKILVKAAPALEKIAESAKNLTVMLGNLKRSTLANIGMWLKWTAKIWLFLKIVPLVQKAIRGIAAAYKALASAKAISLAFGGPTGWATLAASAVIATGAVYGISKAFDGLIDKITETTVTSQDLQQAVADTGGQFNNANSSIGNTADTIQKLTDKLKEESIVWGMTNRQIEIRKLRLAGATEEQIKYAKSLQDTIDNAKKSADRYKTALNALSAAGGKWLDKFTTLGMSDRQKEIYQLEKSLVGLSSEQLDHAVQKLQFIVKLMDEIKKRQDKLSEKEKIKAFFEKGLTAEQIALKEYEKQIGNLSKWLDEELISRKQFIEGYRIARGILENVRPPSPSLGGEGREIDTRYASVSGMAMGGVDPVVKELKEQTTLLQKISGKESLS
ncbi:MAG TPA: hypothetical protein ENH34_05510 [Phycisphaerales bacterium]|nr:hypothetical protein [Phycisphaerales bacterium]